MRGGRGGGEGEKKAGRGGGGNGERGRDGGTRGAKNVRGREFGCGMRNAVRGYERAEGGPGSPGLTFEGRRRRSASHPLSRGCFLERECSKCFASNWFAESSKKHHLLVDLLLV